MPLKMTKMEMNMAAAKAELEARGLMAAWEVWGAPTNGEFAEGVVNDMVGKLIKFGNLTEKQWAFMANLLKQIAERPAKMAARAAEKEAAAPIPAEMLGKRVKVQGEVLTVKGVNGRFGFQVKMLIKAEAGWKVWGTRPMAGAETKKGDVVAFEAKVEVSKDDPKFGFFSRPTNFQMVKAAEPEGNAAWAAAEAA